MAPCFVLEGAVVVDVTPGEGAVSVVVGPGPQDLHLGFLKEREREGGET